MNYSVERKQEDQKTIACWKSSIEAKRQPIEGDIPVNVVQAICNYYEVEFRPVKGYEKVTDRIVACFPWLSPVEQAQWKRIQRRVAFTGISASPSRHPFAPMLKHKFPRLYILTLSALFGPLTTRSDKFPHWIVRNMDKLWFVSYKQDSSMVPLLKKHRATVKSMQISSLVSGWEEETSVNGASCSESPTFGADRNQLSIVSFVQPKSKPQDEPDLLSCSPVDVAAFLGRLQEVKSDMTAEQEEAMMQLVKDEFKNQWISRPEICHQVILREALRKLIQAAALIRQAQEPEDSGAEESDFICLE